MRFGSVCSGIEAASVAWQPLGWDAEAALTVVPVKGRNQAGLPRALR